jgi:hypothetical protein
MYTHGIRQGVWSFTSERKRRKFQPIGVLVPRNLNTGGDGHSEKKHESATSTDMD